MQDIGSLPQWWVLLRVARAAAAKRLSSELLLSYRAVASVVLESSAAQRVPGFCAKHNSLAACNTLGKQARRKLHAKEAHVGAGDAYTYISDHLFLGASAAVAARTNSYSKTPEHKTSPRIVGAVTADARLIPPKRRAQILATKQSCAHLE